MSARAIAAASGADVAVVLLLAALLVAVAVSGVLLACAVADALVVRRERAARRVAIRSGQ